MVFADIAAGFAGALNVPVDIGGYLVGTILLFIVIILFSMISDNWKITGFAIVGSVVFNVMVGWYPIWVILVFGLFLAIILIDPMGEGEGD